MSPRPTAPPPPSRYRLQFALDLLSTVLASAAFGYLCGIALHVLRWGT